MIQLGIILPDYLMNVVTLYTTRETSSIVLIITIAQGHTDTHSHTSHYGVLALHYNNVNTYQTNTPNTAYIMTSLKLPEIM